ncbi:Uncharacterised protein [Yersinia aldovae]|uniref:Uncharacterized protein n=1 Tax=Yersinia aldovae TaxID=29483 RepID=A0A0T9UPV6_YERAL|nr:hypothetical protein AT01_1797 [Yersinia aldovae 670-83]CNK18279.1 Uncharacterised protein [Yersinia aldovae]CNL53297.1 Uncharacterised protein [Yersinia aldovae]CNL59204.1 Uncharacterised protein [Yersinia aldovae]
MKKYTLLLLPLCLMFSSLSYAGTVHVCIKDKVTSQTYCGPIDDGEWGGEG